MFQRQDISCLRKFIERKRPHAVALCGEDMNARYIRREIEVLLHEIGGYFSEVPVEIVDNEAAKVFMHSKQAVVSTTALLSKNTNNETTFTS